MKQIRKSKSRSKNRFCHNRLLSKPDDQAAKAAYKTTYSTLQARWTALAERTQGYADMGDLRTADPGPSKLFGRKYAADKEAILQHWSEHFEGLFSDHRTV